MARGNPTHSHLTRLSDPVEQLLLNGAQRACTHRVPPVQQGDLMLLHTVEQELRTTSAKEGQRKELRDRKLREAGTRCPRESGDQGSGTPWVSVISSQMWLLDVVKQDRNNVY